MQKINFKQLKQNFFKNPCMLFEIQVPLKICPKVTTSTSRVPNPIYAKLLKQKAELIFYLAHKRSQCQSIPFYSYLIKSQKIYHLRKAVIFLPCSTFCSAFSVPYHFHLTQGHPCLWFQGSLFTSLLLHILRFLLNSLCLSIFDKEHSMLEISVFGKY